MTAAPAPRLRSLPDDLDHLVVRRIDLCLADIRKQHRVGIGYAVESGSRAWGFPSPDSDYDCRFVFVRPADQYLSPWQRRDVIETPPDPLLDVNGWELGKALKLLLKGNAVIVEWLTSPLVYDGDPWLHDRLASFARQFADREGTIRHYLHLGERQRRTYFADGKDVQLKKLFYALRPAAALRWLRLHANHRFPPMHFPTLMAECDPPAPVRGLIDELIRRKAETRELGAAPLPEPLVAFVDGEFATARSQLIERRAQLSSDARCAADELFQQAVARVGAHSSTFASGGAR